MCSVKHQHSARGCEQSSKRFVEAGTRGELHADWQLKMAKGEGVDTRFHAHIFK